MQTSSSYIKPLADIASTRKNVLSSLHMRLRTYISFLDSFVICFPSSFFSSQDILVRYLGETSSLTARSDGSHRDLTMFWARLLLIKQSHLSPSPPSSTSFLASYSSSVILLPRVLFVHRSSPIHLPNLCSLVFLLSFIAVQLLRSSRFPVSHLPLLPLLSSILFSSCYLLVFYRSVIYPFIPQSLTLRTLFSYLLPAFSYIRLPSIALFPV
ncbi:hypothetical protein BDW71DRAFT_2018 [Aspergillus fruticulosus]